MRVDGLATRDHTPTEMTEHFEGREDRLFYRYVTYDKVVKRFEPAEKERGRHIHVRMFNDCSVCMELNYMYMYMYKSMKLVRTA